MKHTYSNADGVRKTVHRDAHNPSQLYFETVTDERATLAANAKVRESEALRVGDDNPLVDGDELTAAFRFPTLTDLNLAKKRHPDLFAQLLEGGQTSVAAGERLSILYPEYCTMVRRGDSRR